MTPQYILRKSMCRASHCYSSHVLGKGYVGTEGTDHEEQRMRAAENEIENLGWADGYAEPGYTDPERGILFANWNVFPKDVVDVLERAGYEIEWSDEWTTCEDCNKAVRTSPTHNGWQQSFVETEGSIVCRDCLDQESYLESIEDNPRTCCMEWVDPAAYGYKLIQDHYENGLHQGMDDDPKKIFAELQAKGYTRVVFRLSDTSQFYVTFEAWQWVGTAEERLEHVRDYVESRGDGWHGQENTIEILEAL